MTGRPPRGGRPAPRRATPTPQGASGPAAPRPPKPAYRPPRVDPARRAAYDLLRAVREQDAYANLVLPGMLRERGLTGRDAAFATELAYGTLRGRATYDAVLARCSDRPLGEIDPPVLDVLRLGAHQLLRMRVPEHAAVGETVELARVALSAGPVGFVNAVLRKVAARDLEAWLQDVLPTDDEVGALALRHSHPRWIASALLDALGGDRAELAALLAADEVRPQVHLVARTVDRDELVAQAQGTPGRYAPTAVVLPEGDPRGVPAVRDGRAGVQDEGSQLVAHLLADAPLEGPDALWVDLCAGPGGKAALLDVLARRRGARLLAVELAPHRAQLVRRTGLPRVVVADGRTPPLRPGSVDRVLLDAPCTGLGALRRRPESRWRRQPSDVPGLTRLQGELLAAAATLLRPGGVLAYATCSPHLAETLVPVQDLLRARPDLEQLDATALLPQVPDLGPGPAVQLWPHRHGTDAMHVALLRRT